MITSFNVNHVRSFVDFSWLSTYKIQMQTLLIFILFLVAPHISAAKFDVSEAVLAINLSKAGSKAKNKLPQNTFQILDKKNGYARVTGEFEGYQDYFLFHCQKNDDQCNSDQALVFLVTYDCGPECEQIITRFKVTKKDNDNIKLTVDGPLDIKSIFDFSKSPAKQKEFSQRCLDGNLAIATQQASTSKTCPYFFSFPKKGTSINVLKRFDLSAGISADGQVSLQPVFEFQWKENRFQGTLVKRPKVVLDSAVMTKLF